MLKLQYTHGILIKNKKGKSEEREREDLPWDYAITILLICSDADVQHYEISPRVNSHLQLYFVVVCSLLRVICSLRHKNGDLFQPKDSLAFSTLSHSSREDLLLDHEWGHKSCTVVNRVLLMVRTGT